MSLQEALKLLRLELGMTQSDLAAKLDKAYITVNRWENGKGFPTRSNSKDIIAVAKRYNASDECISYLYEVLMPEAKRSSSAAVYGFPEIDRDFLFQLSDGASTAIYVVEADTYKLLYVNRSAEKLADRYISEVSTSLEHGRSVKRTGKRCYSYFAGTDSPCEFCPIKDIEKSGYEDAVVFVEKTGRRFNVHVRESELNGKKVYSVYLTDITREEAERNSLYELTNDIPIGAGIYSVYLDGTLELVFMNAVLFQMIGEERREALLRNELSGFCLIHLDDKNRLMAEIRSAIAEKRDIEIDMRMRIRDRKYHPVHLSAKLISNAQGKFTFFCLFREKDRSRAK